MQEDPDQKPRRFSAVRRMFETVSKSKSNDKSVSSNPVPRATSKTAQPSVANEANTAAPALAPTLAPTLAPASNSVVDAVQYKHHRSKGIMRIFLSSPFNGLEDERAELTRTYIPRLQDMCREASIQLFIVDMRWGITTQASQTYETINICLSEIDRSDIFVGFYGQRYGWHGKQDVLLQKTFDKAMAKFPWLEDYRDRSITELEFLHGHLNRPDRIPAVFAFRNKKYDDEQVAELKKSNDTKTIPFYQAENDDSRRQLDDLKARVAASSAEFHSLYSTPEEGAKMIYEAIVKIFKDIYHIKPEAPPTAFQRELAVHRAFRDLRARQQEYIGGADYLAAVDKYVAKSDSSGANGLVIIGKTGSGKTMLLASWASQHEKAHPSTLVFYHFIGSSRESTDFRSILRRLLNSIEFSLNTPPTETTTSAASELRRSVTDALTNAHNRGLRVVIVIDGLDLLDQHQDADRVQSMRWWPAEIPSSARVIMSCNPDSHFLEVLGGERCWQTQLKPLKPNEKRKLLEERLVEASKSLSTFDEGLIIEHPATNNPFFLQIVIWELLNHGEFKTLSSKIQSLLDSENITDLFGKVLERFEKDYADLPFSAGKSLIASLSRLLYCTRNGLSDNEIITILDIDQTVWMTLFYALRPYLIVREGIVSFAYEALRQAIWLRYFNNSSSESEESKETVGNSSSAADEWNQLVIQKLSPLMDQVLSSSESDGTTPSQVRLALASYFLKVLADPSRSQLKSRPLEELPWLFAESNQLGLLKQLLVHRSFFLTFIENYTTDTMKFWSQSQVEINEIGPLYRETIETAIVNKTLTEQVGVFHAVGYFLSALKSSEQSFEFLQEAESRAERAFSDNQMHPEYTTLLNLLATVCVDRTEFRQAEVYHRKVLSMRLASAAVQRYCSSDLCKNDLLRNIFNVIELEDNGTMNEIRNKFNSEWTQAEIADLTGYADTIGNIGILKLKVYDFDEAMKWCVDAIALRRILFKSDNSRMLADDLGNIATIKMLSGQLDDAIKMYRDSLTLYDRYFLGSANEDVAGTLLNLGVALRRTGDYPSARQYLERALDVRRKTVGTKSPDYAETLQNLGVWHQTQQQHEEAGVYFLEALHIQTRAYGWRHQTVAFNHENIAMVKIKDKTKEVQLQGIAHARAALATLQDMWLGDAEKAALTRQTLPPPFYNPQTVPDDSNPPFLGSSQALRLTIARMLAGPFQRPLEAAGWIWSTLPSADGYDLLYSLYVAYAGQPLINQSDAVDLPDMQIHVIFPPMPEMLDDQGLIVLLDEGLAYNPRHQNLLCDKALTTIRININENVDEKIWLPNLLKLLEQINTPGSYSQAHQLLAQGFSSSPHPTISLPILQAACTTYPDDVILLYNLGMVLAQLKQYDQAVNIFQKVVSLDPGDVSARVQLGMGLALMGAIEEAQQELNTLLSMIPEDSKDGLKAVRDKAVFILEQLSTSADADNPDVGNPDADNANADSNENKPQTEE